jgi:hypothetical protein
VSAATHGEGVHPGDRHEAEQFLVDLKERLARFGLNLHPEKTRAGTRALSRAAPEDDLDGSQR